MGAEADFIVLHRHNGDTDRIKVIHSLSIGDLTGCPPDGWTFLDATWKAPAPTVATTAMLHKWQVREGEFSVLHLHASWYPPPPPRVLPVLLPESRLAEIAAMTLKEFGTVVGLSAKSVAILEVGEVGKHVFPLSCSRKEETNGLCHTLVSLIFQNFQVSFSSYILQMKTPTLVELARGGEDEMVAFFKDSFPSLPIGAAYGIADFFHPWPCGDGA